MADWIHRYARINGIRMHYVEQGAGVPVILCHGFPHLWFSWRHQIPVIAQAGFRAVAPDMRGMGQTDAPADVGAYDVPQITGDLLGLLDAIDAERAVFVGLDFGAFAVYDLAFRAPERVVAVIGLENPAAPHGLPGQLRSRRGRGDGSERRQRHAGRGAGQPAQAIAPVRL